MKILSAGFTLIELLITLTLVTILSLVIFTALSMSLRIYRTGQARMEASQREKVIVELVKSQIGSTYPVRPQGKFYEPIRTQKAGDPQAAAEQQGFFERLMAARLKTPPLFKGEQKQIIFASFAPLFFRKNAGISMISYAIAQGEHGGVDFVEREEQYRGGQSFISISGVGSPSSRGTVFFSDLEDGSFEFFGAKELDDHMWQPSWDAEAVGRLPLAIRITLTRKDHKKLKIVGVINADGMAGGGAASGAIPPALRGILGGGVQ
jgi:prepilin-type N-terminal cleavage/methylation domain-containing protein